MKHQPAVRHPARIASLVPGRIRIKLNRGSGKSAVLENVKRNLEAREGVREVKLNPAIGSMTVHYDTQQHGPAGILGWLEDLDVLVESVGHVPSVDGDPPARGFLAAVDDLNARIRNATGVPIDFKLALPLSFAAAGVWSIIRRGPMVEAVPGWLFLWFAFDTFVKLHPPHPEPPGRSR